MSNALSSSNYRRTRAGLAWACLLPLAFAGCQVAASGQNAEGVRLYKQAQYPAAYHQFQQAATNDPQSADAFYNMAATLHRQGTVTRDQNLLSQAEVLYNRCLDVDRNHVDCHRGLGVLLVETGRADRAFALMRNWAVDNPRSADARIELARLYQEFGDKKAAETCLVQAIQVDTNSARAHRVLGTLREEAGDSAQALANYQRSYSLNAYQPEIAQRITALRGSTAAPTGWPIPNYPDTRTVSTPNPLPRY